MKSLKKINLGISIALVGLGLAAIILNVFFQMDLAFTWPLAMILVGAAIVFYTGELTKKVPWMAYLYFPGCLALVFGSIFLLNVLTRDWQAWAYAWILIFPALGWGVLMINRDARWPELFNVLSWLLILIGLLFFVAFGALVGGLFIQIAAPLILIIGGMILFRMNEREAFLERFMERFSKVKSESITDSPYTRASAAIPEPLTEREMQVLQLIDQGLSNTEIAERLTLAPSTVKTHINNLYGKLGVQSRVHAIRQARTLGLIQASHHREF